MARKRAATDEQIIEVAEKLATEKGCWRDVYATTVHEHMGVGGSLSTFTKAMNIWRESKSKLADTDITVSEIVDVEDRVSVFDADLSAIAKMLKSICETATRETDRAGADERKKSDRMLSDERETHEKAVSTLRVEIEEIRSENATLADESQAEAERADKAETTVSAREQQIEKLKSEVADMKVELAKTTAQASASDTEAKHTREVLQDCENANDSLECARGEAVAELGSVREQMQKQQADAKAEIEQIRSAAAADLAALKAEAREQSEIARDDVKASTDRAESLSVKLLASTERAARGDELVVSLTRDVERLTASSAAAAATIAEVKAKIAAKAKSG